MKIIVSKPEKVIVEHEGEIYKRMANSFEIGGKTHSQYFWLQAKKWDEAPDIGLEVMFAKIKDK